LFSIIIEINNEFGNIPVVIEINDDLRNISIVIQITHLL